MKEHSIFWWELLLIDVYFTKSILLCGVSIMLISIHKFKIRLLQLILASIIQLVLTVFCMSIYLIVECVFVEELNELDWFITAILAEITTIPLMYYMVRKYNKIHNNTIGKS